MPTRSEDEPPPRSVLFRLPVPCTELPMYVEQGRGEQAQIGVSLTAWAKALATRLGAGVLPEADIGELVDSVRGDMPFEGYKWQAVMVGRGLVHELGLALRDRIADVEEAGAVQGSEGHEGPGHEVDTQLIPGLQSYAGNDVSWYMPQLWSWSEVESASVADACVRLIKLGKRISEQEMAIAEEAYSAETLTDDVKSAVAKAMCIWERSLQAERSR